MQVDATKVQVDATKVQVDATKVQVDATKVQVDASYHVRIISYDSHSHCTPPPAPPRKRGGETKRSFGGVGFLGFNK
ncbi:hypothetical protein H6G93_14225 [Nostoc sp. FACHB-973]|nr:hypothetical protein [Nostoc sp. FACHB-973]